MKRPSIVGCTILMALALVGCGGGAAPSDPASTPASTGTDSLNGTAWALSSLEDASGPVTIIEDARPTLAFEDGTANGFAGCNRFGGTYTVDGGSLAFGELAGTSMGCAPDLLSMEDDYLGSLQGIETFLVEGETLTLSGGGSTLAFTKVTSSDLVGDWTVVNLATQDAITGTVEGQAPTITFETDGSVNGTDGCNRYFGQYTVDGSAIQITLGGGTKMACADPLVDQQSSDFTDAMKAASAYEVAGSQLTLTNESGAIVIVATTHNAA